MTVIQDAFCLTNGVIEETDDCTTEPSLIHDSALLPESLIKQFDDHPDVQLITFGTGNKTTSKSTLTFQLRGAKDNLDYYELFKLKMDNESNGLYSPIIHTLPEGSYIELSTSNVETTSGNQRLTVWINNVFTIIDNVNISTTNYVPEMEAEYESTVKLVDAIDESLNVIVEEIDNGEDKFAEQNVAEISLQSVAEDVTTATLTKIFQSSAVQNIINDSSIASQITSEQLTSSVTPLTSTSETSNFDTVLNSIMPLIESLSTIDSGIVKTEILNELSNLTSLPSDTLTEYTQLIMDNVDGFPFTDITSIKDSVTTYATGLKDSIVGDGKDFITTAAGLPMTMVNNVMDEFGLQSAKDMISKLTAPGNLSNLAKSVSNNVVNDVMTQLPINDVKSVINDVKRFSTFPDLINGGVAGSYAQKIMDMGLESSGINSVMSSLKSELVSMKSTIDSLKSGATGLMDSVKSMTNISGMMQQASAKIMGYVNSAQSMMASYWSVAGDLINTRIAGLVDLSALFGQAADKIAQISGQCQSATCLLSYGLGESGLV